MVMPFLPLYIDELGVSNVGEVAMWTGLILGATPAVTAISAPFWGRIGDRFGSKLLVLRSLGAFVLTKGAMAFVTAPWQLFVLRALLGLFAGYGALTVSMAAESVPRDQMAKSIGLVQMGQRLGPAVGPLVGGLIAPLVGIRRSFLLTAGCYVLALILMGLFYKDPRESRTCVTRRSLRVVLQELVTRPGFVLLLGIIFAMQLVDRSFGPILPLYVSQLGVAPARVATVAGMLFSISALCAAVGHRIAGGLLTAFTPRRLVTIAALSAAAGIGVAILIPALTTIALAMAVAGAAIGVGMTAAYAAAGSVLPADAHLTGFGLMTTASLTGLAVSPVIAGLIGASGLRIVFVFDVVVLGVLAWAVWARMRSEPVSPAPSMAPDAS